ncbi:glucokinase [Massilia sp. YIM B02443]|uniref:glucokinase n=1 Tax=Massilia sp. YIM B02443 TaxID=3050127 RepID=UPI0025B65569|nr:glucokinase [Massilia sp. YIM B02443]MDN4038852.1 glucokinase [Massilia sp. YIM B02443]
MQANTPHPGGPRLLADIGGTNARFALETAPGSIEAVQTLACADHPRFEDAVRAYLGASVAGCGGQVRHAAIAIANPVDGDEIKMTNHHWAFSIEAARYALGLDTLLVVNDFTALAMSLPALQDADLVRVGGGAARAGCAIGLVGAGTGLGVSGLVPSNGRWIPLHSEGGHVAFSPLDEREADVLRFAWQRFDHVSAERFVSGPGLALIHEALADRAGIALASALAPSDVVARGLEGGDALCKQAVDVFCGMLGTVAANLAVTLGAQGGIYIGGGVVPRLGDYFASSPFRERFERKGRLSGFTARIPTFLITASYPALQGASRLLADHLADHPARLHAVPSTREAANASI